MAEKIMDELIKVRHLKEKDVDENETVVTAKISRVKEEVIRIKGIAEAKDTDRYKMLAKYADGILRKVEEYEIVVLDSEKSGEEKRLQQRLGADIWKVRRL